MEIAILHDRIRAEEKMLVDEFDRRGVAYQLVDNRKIGFQLDRPETWRRFSAVYDRSVSFSRSLASLQILTAWEIPVVNTVRVTETCGNKLATNLAFLRNGVPTPQVRVAYSSETAIAAMEQMGYPVVVKPAIGSWGRLLCKINDRDAAEAILEHKTTLGDYSHSIFYIQQYIEKAGGRDVRSFVVDGETICAIARHSQHWITNTARGATTENFPVTETVDRLSRAAAQAVGGGVLAIDLFEDQSGEWAVNEVNHSMEFRNSIRPTGVNIPAKMVDYVLKVAEGVPRGDSKNDPSTQLMLSHP
jgi:[lysine-biosynthesis-protein LysW]--L-2-aminoadipate ligase